MVVLHDFLHQLTLSFWNFYYSLFFLFEKLEGIFDAESLKI